MTLNTSTGIINFITDKEIRVPAGRPFEIDTNILVDIPTGMVMLITSDKYAVQSYGITVNPSPLIISSDETSKTISISVLWDGVNRWATEIDLHGRVKIPANTKIAKAIMIDVAQNFYTTNTNE